MSELNDLLTTRELQRWRLMALASLQNWGVFHV